MQDLTKRSRDLRNNPTEPEAKLWARLRASQLGGYKFRRQSAREPFIADFFCPAKGLVVEVDGDTHQAARDASRDGMLARQGFRTIRFTNADVMQNIEGVLQTILTALDAQPDRWPHPNPSPEGEGLSRC